MNPPNRTAAPEARQQQILAAARRLFRKKGFDSTTVSEIVKEAGIAQGTFYLYFSSKRDLIFALNRLFVEMAVPHVAEAYQLGATFEERLQYIINACFQVARENSDLIGMLFALPESSSTEFQADFLENNPILKALTEMFSYEIEAGSMEPMDPEIAGRLVMGTVKTAWVEGIVLGNEEYAQRMEEQVTRMLVNGLKRQR